MKHYANIEVQLNPNGAIGTIAVDMGTNEKGAISRLHTALASVPESQLVAGASVMVVFDDELQDSGGYIVGEVLKGTGTLQTEETTQEENTQEEQEGGTEG